MKSVFLAAMFLTLPAAASDFSTRYPAGSVRDAQQAQAALKDADAEMARIASRATSRESECYKGILVNSCRDDVRREKELAERDVRRVRVEARDLQRRLDAEDLGKRRAEKGAARATKEAQKPTEQKPARTASPPRDPHSESHGREERRPTQEKLSAAERAENARKFQQKQAQAAKRAQEREDERTKNEERRAAKRKQIEQREAEREAIRRKAAELEKKL